MKNFLVRLISLSAIVFALAGCTALTAQNPSGSLKPVNAVADGEDSGVMLKGADVVAYFTQNQYVQGVPQFKSNYQGVTFRFSSAANKALFDFIVCHLCNCPGYKK